MWCGLCECVAAASGARFIPLRQSFALGVSSTHYLIPRSVFHDLPSLSTTTCLTLAECFCCGRTVEVSEIGTERAAAGWSALASGPTDGALPVAGNNECRRLAAQSRWKRYFSHPSHFYGERRTVTLGGERVYVRNNRLTV